MGLSDWFSESQQYCRQYGLRQGGRISALTFWEGAATRLGDYWNYGDSVFEEEWDILMLLDTCRPDALEEVAPEYEFLPSSIPTHTSVASTSKEWIRKTFTEENEEVLSNTAYVTANPFSTRAETERLGLVDEVWKYGWNDELGTPSPEAVTDRAIEVWRTEEYEKLIIHYMQPHAPYRGFKDKYDEWYDSVSSQPIQHGGEEGSLSPRDDYMWDALRRGVMDRDEAWEAYLDNLQWVLEDGVEPFLQNADSDSVVISSDHGEGFGEWGLYSHPAKAPFSVLKTVPWVEVSATDTHEREPDIEIPESVNTVSEEVVSERLSSLGYVE